MHKETKIQRLIQLELSKAGHTFWRNETGYFWAGKVIHREGNTVTLADARMVPCGLAVGSHDLIGIQKGTGLFSSVEVKTPQGRPTKEQLTFRDHVLSCGGIAGIARSPEEALQLLSVSS